MTTNGLEVKDFNTVRDYAMSVSGQHNHELQLYSEVNPSFESYEALDKVGALVSTLFYCDNVVCGYSINCISSSFNDKNKIIFQNLLFFVDKKYRVWYNGYNFIKKHFDIARQCGASVVKFEAIADSDFELLMQLLSKRNKNINRLSSNYEIGV